MPDTERATAATTADRLLETAATLFRRQGYAQTTTRELASMLGIQKASLYHHISTKEDLLYALCKESLRRSTEEVARAIESVPEAQRLRAAVRAHVTST